MDINILVDKLENKIDENYRLLLSKPSKSSLEKKGMIFSKPVSYTGSFDDLTSDSFITLSYFNNNLQVGNSDFERTTVFSNPFNFMGTIYENDTLNNKTGYNSSYGINSLKTNRLIMNNGLANSGFGYATLFSNTEGRANTALSNKVLYTNTIGVYNTGIGNYSLYHNTNGNSNTGVGFNSLLTNVDGSLNTSTGAYSLLLNTGGSYNCCYGARSGYSNTTGTNNVASGYQSFYSNTTGSYNVVSGAYALQDNTTGEYNVGIGYQSLQTNSSGSNNTAIGTSALFKNTSADGNTAVGAESLYYTTTGKDNTGCGYFSLHYNTEGENNVAIGTQALLYNETGKNNTAVGMSSLRKNETGNNNTAVGYDALLSNTSYSNCTGVGNGADVSGDNQIQLGNSATTVYTYGTASRSDIRDKTNIRDTVLGLDFIGKLRPVDYQFDYREDYRETITKVDENLKNPNGSKIEYKEIIQHEKDGSKIRKRFHHGLIAQEIKEVMDELNVDFAGYKDGKINGGEDILSISYEELIGPLIKSIQELKTINESLTKRIELLENKN